MKKIIQRKNKLLLSFVYFISILRIRTQNCRLFAQIASQQSHIFFLYAFSIVFSLLILNGCNIPNPEMIQNTQTAESLFADIFETAQASIATDTPVPSPVPTYTKTIAPSSTPAETEGPTVTPTLGPEFFHGSLQYDPKFVSQDGLRYNGSVIKTGCTAASVEMLLDFWHSYKAEYPVMKAQTLIDRNTWQGKFNVKTGLNILDTEDELFEMNYYLGVRENSNKEELLAALERYGPLLVLTKVNWTPFGANHMAVISSYFPEEDIIRILDPWQEGGIMEFPYDNFDGIWSLNYLDDPVETLRRTFFFIVPYAELPREEDLFIKHKPFQK